MVSLEVGTTLKLMNRLKIYYVFFFVSLRVQYTYILSRWIKVSIQFRYDMLQWCIKSDSSYRVVGIPV